VILKSGESSPFDQSAASERIEKRTAGVPLELDNASNSV
jgi:hypothetical protein